MIINVRINSKKLVNEKKGCKRDKIFTHNGQVLRKFQ